MHLGHPLDMFSAGFGTAGRIVSGLALFCAWIAATESRAADPAPSAAEKHGPAQFEFFKEKVRPILREACVECHGARKQKGHLRLDSFAALLKGGDAGAAIKPGNADLSLLIQSVLYLPDAEEQMPPKGKLSEQQIADLTAWVKMGAPWPPAEPTIAPPNEDAVIASADMRRLSHREYLRSIERLTGVRTGRYGGQLPIDASINGFDNQASALQVSSETLESYREITADVIAQAFKDPGAAATRFFPSCPTLAKTCVTDAVARLGRRVFRRPLDDEELRGLRALVVDGHGRVRKGAAPALLETMLLSPQFLFRSERGEPVPGRPGVRRLTSYEAASALSFALWGETPEDKLLDAAEASLTLDSRWLAQQTAEMLKDKRADSSIESFGMQWLRVPSIDLVPIAGTVQGLDINLRWAATDQLRRMIRRYFTRDANATGFLDTAVTDINDRLAKVYELPTKGNDGTREITLAEDDDRRGFFGTPGFSFITSHVDRTSEILQGLYVRNKLLCDSVPPPPATLAAEISKDPDAHSSEARLSKQPCAGCHRLLDPIGRGLAGFTVIGARDPSVARGTARGSIEGYPDATFNSPATLAKVVLNTGRVPQCIVEHTLAWLKGRGITSAEGPLVEQLVKGFEGSGYRYKELLALYIGSEDFLYRKDAR